MATVSKGTTLGYWIPTALLCFILAFNVYAQLALPFVAENFTRMGFPAYFRVELSIAKAIAVVVLLVPVVPWRLKEWAYAGVLINLISALVAHFAMGDGPEAWSFAVLCLLLWGTSYFFWRKREAAR